MKRLLLSVALVLAALLGLTACSGSVTGEVSGKSNGEPVQGATVRVGSQTAQTDSSGRYSLGDVTTGAAKVSVEAEGYGHYAGSFEVKRGDNTVNVTLVDGSVHGVLKENAAVREPIKQARVTLAGEDVTVEGARFDAAGVPVGEQTLKIVAPGHQPYVKSITVAPGDNVVAASLELTPTETYMRYYFAYRFRRFREAYEMLHPDVRKHYSYPSYAKDMRPGITLSIKIFGAKTLAKWRPAYLRKTYKHVVAIDRAVKTQYAFGPYTDNFTQHWQQIDGRSYIIFNWKD